LLALLNPTGFVQSSGYLAIFVLSVLQSCCVPTSSELTLGFGGVLAAEGKLSLPGVIAVGALGELVGAYIAWFIGRTGGRGFVDRYGKYVLLSHRDLDRAEAWYGSHSQWGVFGSRLVPVIRNFVALPAGVAEVPLVRFGLLTAAGSLIWDAGMALIGYEVGHSYKKVLHGFSYAGYLLGAAAVVALVVLFVHRYHSYKEATAVGSPPSGHSRRVDGEASTASITDPADPVAASAEMPAPGVSPRPLP
jgi:membrane protein DedA with SNARE-associated domain